MGNCRGLRPSQAHTLTRRARMPEPDSGRDDPSVPSLDSWGAFAGNVARVQACPQTGATSITIRVYRSAPLPWQHAVCIGLAYRVRKVAVGTDPTDAVVAQGDVAPKAKAVPGAAHTRISACGIGEWAAERPDRTTTGRLGIGRNPYRGDYGGRPYDGGPGANSLEQASTRDRLILCFLDLDHLAPGRTRGVSTCTLPS